MGGDYRGALEAAGATVFAYEEFGDYQGEWWALVEHNGKRGWVTASYGSCSGCDSYESEIGSFWSDDEAEKAAHAEKLRLFGAGYLLPQDIMSDEQALAASKPSKEWYSERREAHAFVKKHVLSAALAAGEASPVAESYSLDGVLERVSLHK